MAVIQKNSVLLNFCSQNFNRH